MVWLKENAPNFGGIIRQIMARKANWLIDNPNKTIRIANKNLSNDTWVLHLLGKGVLLALQVRVIQKGYSQISRPCFHKKLIFELTLLSKRATNWFFTRY